MKKSTSALLAVAASTLLLQACASREAKPVDRDIMLFAAYPVYIQQQICTTTRTGVAEVNSPQPVQDASAPVAAASGNPQVTAAGQGAGHGGRSGSGRLTADQERLRLAVQEQRYGCYARQGRARYEPGISLAPYGLVVESSLATPADFKAAADVEALREARRARQEMQNTTREMGLDGGLDVNVGGSVGGGLLR